MKYQILCKCVISINKTILSWCFCEVRGACKHSCPPMTMVHIFLQTEQAASKYSTSLTQGLCRTTVVELVTTNNAGNCFFISAPWGDGDPVVVIRIRVTFCVVAQTNPKILSILQCLQLWRVPQMPNLILYDHKVLTWISSWLMTNISGHTGTWVELATSDCDGKSFFWRFRKESTRSHRHFSQEDERKGSQS